MPIKTLSVIGTRPEAIKMAPVILALSADREFESRVCATGQHRQMLDSAVSLFSLKVDYDLDVMVRANDIVDASALILQGVRDVIRAERPDVVIVHGDTATTMAASIAAYYERVSVAHVEAGLRTGDLYAPWPEEGNRLIAGALASIHFAPTDSARENLIRSGVQPGSIYVTGNTVIDALQMIRRRSTANSRVSTLHASRFPFLQSYDGHILVTGHRRESFGDGIARVCRALSMIAASHPEIALVYPVHLNPNIDGPVRSLLGKIPNIHLLDPLDYESFVYLMGECLFVLTDSGGIQEEAPALGKPVLLMRDTTERPEGVAAGAVRLVGTDPQLIYQSACLLLERGEIYEQMCSAKNPFGDGRASARIREALSMRFKKAR